MTAPPKQTSVPKLFAVDDPSWQPFIHFLTASVKDVHPTAESVGGVWLTPERKVNAAKEIAYQQRKFLDFSKTFIDTRPWVTFLTCIKHRHVEDRYELSAASFRDMADKRFWDELTVDVQETRAAAEELLDTGTVEEVKELCEFQTVADKIAIAPETLRKLRDLSARIKIGPKKTWITITCVLVVSAILAGLGAAVFGIKELRSLLFSPAIEHEGLQENLASLAALLGFGGIISAVYCVVKTGGAAANTGRYLGLFMTDIAPCLRLMNVDASSGKDNLDHVEVVISSVSEKYRQLQAKLLTPFLPRDQIIKPAPVAAATADLDRVNAGSSDETRVV
jgi:hypothetical protein